MTRKVSWAVHIHRNTRFHKELKLNLSLSRFRGVARPHRRLCGVCSSNHYSRQAQKCIITTFLSEREVTSLYFRHFYIKIYLNKKQRKCKTLKMCVCATKHEGSAVQCRAEHAASGPVRVHSGLHHQGATVTWRNVESPQLWGDDVNVSSQLFSRSFWTWLKTEISQQRRKWWRMMDLNVCVLAALLFFQPISAP